MVMNLVKFCETKSVKFAGSSELASFRATKRGIGDRRRENPGLVSRNLTNPAPPSDFRDLVAPITTNTAITPNRNREVL
jgi:hypothetical protein